MFLKLLGLLLFFTLYLAPNFFLQAQVFDLDDSTKVYTLGKDVFILPDKEGTLTIDDVSRTNKVKDFKLYRDTEDIYDDNIDVYWVRFTLKNTFPSNRMYLLKAKDVEVAYLYTPTSNGISYLRAEDGVIYPLHSRSIKMDRSACFVIPLNRFESKTFFLRIEHRTKFSKQNKEGLNALRHITVEGLASAIELSKERRYYQGFYLGAMVLLALNSLFVSFLFRDKRYLYYVGLLLMAAFLNMIFEEYLIEFFIPNNPAINWLLVVPVISLLWFFYTLFFRSFLNLKKIAPFWDKFFIGIAILCLIILGLSIVGFHKMDLMIGLLIFTISSALIVNIGIVIKFKHRPASFLLAANIVYFSGIFIFIFAQENFIPNSYFAMHASQIADILLGLFVSLGLADRVNYLRTEIERKNEDNRTLIEEQKTKLEKEVSERTREITKINMELVTQQEEVTRQKEQIEKANDNLKEQQGELRKAYQDINLLSDIGQDITASLDIGVIINTVYKHVDEMMDTTVFGIGTYNPEKETIGFSHFYKNGEILPYRETPIQDDRLSTWCARNKKPVFINDFDEEYSQYLEGKTRGVLVEERNSIIYYPLIQEEKLLGVITVQSPLKNAYSRSQYRILESMAAYITIALSNYDAYQTIQSAKDEIDRKNLQITDSLRYARDIQGVILPGVRRFNRTFKDHFLLYKPKDFVSGDFFWIEEYENKTFVAVIDCTGHGVPGAFMSLIGTMQLNQIVSKTHEPSEILDHLHTGIKKALKQDIYNNDDGMDVCLCSIEHLEEINRYKVIFAGAKRPLYYVNENSLHQLKGTRKTIGGRAKNNKLFEQDEIWLNEGDALYLTTDGYVDQSSPRQKKIGTMQLLTWLEQINAQPMSKQGEFLKEELARHQQYVEQRDDITLLGIRL
ncbi:7TM-containing protein possibly involved in signal transduction [Bernardetia litoralis DSM 6794]|uniref:7TM-containing protein possibly involved in signal transduction n=1 Tax=Bernardetia litoralis (strain ATCC 23117 / DSM 6794 / NBRC 15988 / NCIMB 1366 / Fx l1 / Sio-4) TaxID=880071 RepID=I4AL52_BERLS|nr:7TM-containing protein possibly involved in signal transduction [Bernardetia litoralis DSM 6794]